MPILPLATDRAAHHGRTPGDGRRGTGGSGGVRGLQCTLLRPRGHGKAHRSAANEPCAPSPPLTLHREPTRRHQLPRTFPPVRRRSLHHALRHHAQDQRDAVAAVRGGGRPRPADRTGPSESRDAQHPGRRGLRHGGCGQGGAIHGTMSSRRTRAVERGRRVRRSGAMARRVDPIR